MTTQLQHTKNQHSNENYNDKVFLFLQNGKVGTSYTLDRICAKENQPDFIALVKEFMVLTPWQGGWEFSSDFKKLKKVNVNSVKKAFDRGMYGH